MNKTIIVHSRHHLMLRVDHWWTGKPVAFAEVKVGANEVDDDFWRAWFQQNKDGQLVASGSGACSGRVGE